MNKNVNQVIDSVSASQLIKALSTLQQLSQKQGHLQISFCKQELSQNKDNIAHSKHLDFESYMAGQVTQNNNCNKQVRKSISPLKQYQQDNTSSKASNIKSRSHSPFQKRTQRTDSRISKYSKQTIKSAKYSEKQNKKKEEPKKEAKYPSFQSKKIMDNKQRSGVNYIPIQYRAGQVLKEKQIKLAKLQKEKQISKIMEEKECTFRPIITKYKKTTQAQKDYSQQKVSEDQMNRFQQCFIDQQYLCTPTQAFAKEEGYSQQQLFPKKGKEVNQNNQTKVVIKKYKNQKFNCLLDLIH